jgi:hypothetical protein
LTCAIIGSFIGDILSPYLPSLLSKSFEIGVKPFLINLKVLSITLGFTVSMNVMSVVGVVIALIIFGKH